MYIIDQSHIFHLKHSWNKNNLNELIKKCDYKDDNILRINWGSLYSLFLELNIIKENILRSEAENFKKLITRQKLEQILSTIPSSWSIKNDDLQGLIDYIMYRVEYLDKIIDMIMDFIKEYGGM